MLALLNNPLGSDAAHVEAVWEDIKRTNVGMLPDLLQEGENGLLVAPGAVAAMTERLAWLVNDRELARRLGIAGRQTVAREYSLAAMLQRYEELYLSLLEK